MDSAEVAAGQVQRVVYQEQYAPSSTNVCGQSYLMGSTYSMSADVFPGYSQCLPGSAAPSSTPKTTLSTATRTTSVSSVVTSGSRTSSATSAVTSSPGTPNPANPIAGKTFWANPYYSSEIVSLAAPSLSAAGSASWAAKATNVAKVGTFYWL